jgi:sodium/potassium-transporting ATPase subunit alpha
MRPTVSRTARASAAPSFLGLERAALLAALKTDGEGLTSAEARSRLRRHGPNEIVFHRARSPLAMLAAEFVALFPLLLLVAAGLSFVAHALVPEGGYGLIGGALLGVVVLNALVSFLQNYRVEKLMLSFLDYIPRRVALKRDGAKVLLDAKAVVPGDVLFIQEGDKVSADGIVLACERLLLDESALTGESEPVARRALDADGGRVEAEHRVVSGATVVGGNARVLVTRTGRATGLGAVSALAQGVTADLTPMQQELRRFVRRITVLAVGIGVVFFAAGMAIGNPFLANLVFAVGIIVANVPEGLLPTVTLALTQSSVRMSRRNAVIKHILSVETLGSTTVVCTDKTGTLTRNRLHVERLFLGLDEVPAGGPDFRADPGARPAVEIMALCNGVLATRDGGARRNAHRDALRFKGDPTEVALAELVEREGRAGAPGGEGGFEALRGRFENVAERPFDADAKYMSATWRTRGGTLFMTVKGAPGVVLERCARIHAEGLVRPLAGAERERLAARADAYADEGLRVLALAYGLPAAEDAEAADLVFVGLVALVDPPRREVPAAVAACRTAGVRIVVMSGDKAETVAYIAKQLGIVTAPRVIEGPELEAMDEAALVAALEDEQVVFARIAPAQKLAVVSALKAMGHVVAVTGDGVNDAPALKRADIGISMGLRGTDVAKEASDIILLDDNFATIVRAIEEGRAVYDNIRKFVTYVLTSNVPEILPFIAYVLLPIPLPITVVQILSIDLITDILPAIGLGNEPPEADVMRRPPRPRDERMVSARIFARSYGFIGLAESALSFGVFFAVLHAGGWTWGAPLAADAPLYRQAAGAFLAGIIFCQVGNVMACRTARQSALPHLARLNPWIAAGVALEVAFIVTVVEAPGLHRLFTTAPLPAWAWGAVLLGPPLVFGLEELRKLLAPGRRKRASP